MSLIDLHLLLRSTQNWKKFTFLDNLRTITQEGNMRTRQMTQKLPIQTSQHTILETRHPEVTKHLYYVSFPCRSQILILLGSRSCTIIAASFYFFITSWFPNLLKCSSKRTFCFAVLFLSFSEGILNVHKVCSTNIDI